MSKANIEAVRQVFSAAGRRDLHGLLEHMDPDVELRPLASVWPRMYRGHKEIEQWLRDVEELWREFSVEAEGFRELGHGTLLVRMRWHGWAKRGSTELEAPAAAVVRFQGEKIVSLVVHLDEERALASAAS